MVLVTVTRDLTRSLDVAHARAEHKPKQMTGQKEQKIVFGKLSLQRTRGDGQAFKPTAWQPVLSRISAEQPSPRLRPAKDSGRYQQNASHSKAVTVMSGKTAKSCRGLAFVQRSLSPGSFVLFSLDSMG